MSLTPGTRLGVYDITAPIGEGGMGQVYRATDTTLGRQVAIKILPDAFAADPDRLARFEREAKTLASLNHPYIAAIYGFEKSGGLHALVMELVEGEDLSQRIGRGAIPIDEALPIAKQIRDCLVRDPRQRLRDIGEARRVLDTVIAGAPDTVDGSRLSTTDSRRPTRSSTLPWAIAGAAVVAAGVLLMLWAPWRLEKPADRPLVRLDVDLGTAVSFPPSSSGRSLAISPDGTRLVYVSGTPTKLFTRRLDQPTAAELPGTQGAARPFFSPDGQWVGFVVNGKINKISAEGGAVVPLGEAGTFVGASWAEDGSIFVSDFRKGLVQFPAAGGAPTIVAPFKGEALVLPQLLPGGTAILFASCASADVDNCNIEVLTLVDGRRKILARGGSSPHYLPSSNGTGHLVYLNKATLFAIPFELATLETRGTAVPVLDDVATASTGTGLFDVSRTGTVIYRRSRGDVPAMTTVRWVSPSVGPTGKQEPLRATPGAYQTPRLSADGRRIALVIVERGNADVWVYDLQRDALTRLTFGGINGSPAWSQDGHYVVFQRLGQGIFQARADGASQPQPLTGSMAIRIPWSFTPDGRRLAYVEMGSGKLQIWIVPLEDQGGQLKAGTPEPFLKSTFSDQAPSFSPDGRWLAYMSDESGRNEVYIREFLPASAGQGAKWQVSNNGGDNPRWSRTGHELVYQSGNQLMTVSYAVNGNTFVADRPRVWIAALGGADWDLAPDGKRVAVLIPEGTAQAPQQEHVIVMLQNFTDELRRRVPVGK